MVDVAPSPSPDPAPTMVDVSSSPAPAPAGSIESVVAQLQPSLYSSPPGPVVVDRYHDTAALEEKVGRLVADHPNILQQYRKLPTTSMHGACDLALCFTSFDHFSMKPPGIDVTGLCPAWAGVWRGGSWWRCGWGRGATPGRCWSPW